MVLITILFGTQAGYEHIICFYNGFSWWIFGTIFEWLVFSLEKQEGYWEHLIIEYYKEEYKDGLGPRGVQKMVTSMVPDWWIELLPTSTRGEIRSALKKINSGTEDLAQRRQAKFS